MLTACFGGFAARNMWVPGLTQRLATAVYSDGKVCISILHNPGDDPHGYENASERWSPIHTVSPVLLMSTWTGLMIAAHAVTSICRDLLSPSLPE